MKYIFPSASVELGQKVKHMDDATNTQAVSPSSISVQAIHARPGSIARFALGFWIGRPKQEALMQLTNPLGQHLALYVPHDEKARVIAELRKLLTEWEAQP